MRCRWVYRPKNACVVDEDQVCCLSLSFKPNKTTETKRASRWLSVWVTSSRQDVCSGTGALARCEGSPDQILRQVQPQLSQLPALNNPHPPRRPSSRLSGFRPSGVPSIASPGISAIGHIRPRQTVIASPRNQHRHNVHLRRCQRTLNPSILENPLKNTRRRGYWGRDFVKSQNVLIMTANGLHYRFSDGPHSAWVSSTVPTTSSRSRQPIERRLHKRSGTTSRR